MIPLKDSSALKLTTASYFTPNGRMIRGQGIIPDVVVEREEAGPGDFEEGPVDIFEKLASEPPSGPRKGPPPSKKAPPDKRAPEKKTPAEEKIGRDSQLEKARDLIKTLRVYGAGK
jgi:carboxyl-terminal processing protease